MALPPNSTGVYQARGLALTIGPTEAVAITQAEALTVYNIPSFDMETTFAGANVAYNRTALQIDVQMAGMLAVVKGRTANPRIRAWTFSLDGHDFYVLRLGDKETLIYDTATEQWTDWTYSDLPFWRPNTGTTWIGGAKLANDYGSSIVIGDDTFGLLWFLDPDTAYDQHPVAENTKQQIPFPRVVTGQVLASGRQQIPCYAIFVDGDNYGLTATDFVPSVTLETSDDQGRTFFSHGTLTVTPDFQNENPYTWYSLGQFSSPGRIFRLTDNGLFTRVDSMEMNDDAG